jgi:hypothetical protein
MHIELPANKWEPRPQQMRAWNALSRGVRTAVLAWHRRMGKDEIALHNCAIKAMQRTGNYWHMLPMQEQARKALWEGVNPRTGRVRWKDAFPEEIIKHVDNQGMKLTFVNDSTWQLLGSDNYNSLVGSTPVGITMSEAALADPAAFGYFRPILLENNGWSLHISSVRGRNHFKSLFDSVSKDPDGFAELLSAEDTGIFTGMQLAAERKFYIDQYGSAFGNALFEQEYLSNWDAAIIGAVWGEELKTLRSDGRAAPFIYDPRFPVYTSWDIGVGDPTYVLFWQIIGNRPRLIGWYSSTDTGVDHYVEVLSKKPYYYAKHIGPHDIINRGGGSANSWFEQGRKLGLNFERMENTAKLDSIAAGAYLIRQMEVNTADQQVDDPMDDCEFILSALTQYRFAFDQERKVMSKNPVHDWTSHPSDALMTFALWFSDQKGIVGRPAQVQGRSAELETHDPRRLREIFAHHQAKRKGAFG